MNLKEKALIEFEHWYKDLIVQPNRFPARGTIGAALVVLEHLKVNFDLTLSVHQAKRGRAQISGVSGNAVAKILARFGETRPFLKEGGRTNRGTPGDVAKMLDRLKNLDLQKSSRAERNAIIEDLQRFLVDKVRRFHGSRRLKFVYDPTMTVRQSVQKLLSSANESGKEGPVAQYLVGAKLERKLGKAVENKSYSTADEQLGRAGDFEIGDTAFHVTVAPMPAVYERCQRNLQAGLRVYLLVPEKVVVAARQQAEVTAPGRISVESIESFVGQNIDELSAFSKEALTQEMCQLLDTYNRRVDEIEADKSFLIDIPQNLRPKQNPPLTKKR